MHDHTQTTAPESSALIDVAQMSDDAKSVLLGDSLVLPNDVSHDDLPPDAGCMADATNKPQASGSPDTSSTYTTEPFSGHEWKHDHGFAPVPEAPFIDSKDTEPTMSNASSTAFDQGDSFASSAASDYTDDEDTDSMCSLDSEYLNYHREHGRRYPAESQGESRRYFWPNDEPQQRLLNLLHEAERCLLDGQLHEAPIRRDVQGVLDVGTGTGNWAIDFADDHPSAQVIGTDISPTQPDWVPPNLQFQMDDANLEWTFEERFELIHSRGMVGSITDWDKFAKNASDDKTHENCGSMMRWEGFWNDVGNNSGRSFTVVEDRRLEKSMQLAGFTDIKTRVYKMPVGGWPKDPRLREVGLYTHAALDADLEGLMLRPAVEVLGWGLDKVYLLAAELRKELRSGKVHAYLCLKVVFGQKP
ncbi:hypothetical protein CEP54_016119 [Fusarium duplospermum]|uniref:Methyltransferase n=1 Tax=Fusarium duplospermum TaxID=1325734 RepID=A0A428NI66_9HYPO|nr:hypothetical protein CEP54_016119 [Fusarium duplospermum]